MAGVALFFDNENYRHFALGEHPDPTGSTHFPELREMYKGEWIAECAAGTKPTQTRSMNMKAGSDQPDLDKPC